jgi:lipopolysaccharide biosynthesis glycosyltransferase
MSEKKILISSSDDKYFILLLELINSFFFHNLDKNFEFGVIDTGLTNDQIFTLKNKNIIVKQGKWDVSFPQYKIRGREYLKNIIARAYLPDYFQGFDKYIWLDADTWINDKSTFLLLDEGCNNDKICIIPQVDRAYGKFAKVEWVFNFPKKIKTINFKNIKRSISSNLAKKYAMYPTLNGGVFSIGSNAKIWKSFQKNVELASRKGRIFGTDQVALIMMIHEDKISAEFLPAYVNWLCEFNLPFYDKVNDKFVEPYLPHHPVGLMHLAGLDDLRTNKEILYKIKTLDGKSIEKSLRF